ncbi:acetyl/propionyl/methylcrotonyl-CoA carboxylase subunit alpha [Alteromonas sp. D210916BOD_24]|uniref:acetyl/propionyl/methylcrotonyl-CoA carboxylase subunit alpha n=1 Tax=Alteromonas sp. D210916BOD_24 TaxID=3157618 RepID=UPI00399CE778
MKTTIHKILIANRGEIACRIIRTAHAQGYYTVAVYSEADRDARHVELADEAVLLGPADAASSYLNQQRIIEAALATQADAIHPGYGFLSENADFARNCTQSGITFIGPRPEAIALMGSKRLSKIAMLEAGVPCIAGYQGDDQSDATLLQKATEIGFPLMVKASAGGGGKGMRLVWEENELDTQIRAARSEAQKAFGNDELILEQALIKPRHIEIQIFADAYGNTIYLGERDCSIQRRHQKVIEEAPSPFVDETLRQKMGEAAVNAAKACQYCGAGTVEFLVDTHKRFYFLEMNTRLQVEHPVTELVTGLDLVDWQLRIAAGEPLPLTQQEVTIKGHAIEARLYAEDPRQQFFPQTGHVWHWQPPREANDVRVDHAMQVHSAISAHYDPMLAKVIAWGDNRASAARKLTRAITDTQLLGVNTNKHFLARILMSTGFLNDAVTTHFIEQHANTSAILGSADPSFLCKAVAAALFICSSHISRAEHWQAAIVQQFPITLSCNEKRSALMITQQQNVFSVTDATCQQHIEFYMVTRNPNGCDVHVNGVRQRMCFWRNNDMLFIDDGQGHYQFNNVTHHQNVHHNTVQATDIRAVMDGAIVALLCNEGCLVESGQTVAIMEAMKMEHPLKAQCTGTVSLHVSQIGEQVKTKQVIATITPTREDEPRE